MKAYLFRGLAGTVFSTGIDRLANKLQIAGIETSVHSWADRRETQAEALRHFRSGKISGPIILAGHSLGGNSANLMANYLVSKKIPVSYVATIDPTSSAPGPVGVNADNFRSWDPRAKKIRGATQFRRRDLNHIQIDKDEKVHSRIVSMCLSESDNLISNARRCHKPKGRYNSNGRVQNKLPVRNALGERVGNILNGRKTAAGLLGMLGMMVAPALAGSPDAATTETMQTLQNAAFPVCMSLFAWGVLGKAEKWVKQDKFGRDRPLLD